RHVGEVGAGLRRVDRRPGRRPAARHAALAAVGIHHTGAGALRGRRARGRGAGARHLTGHPLLRARHRRALPQPDPGVVAVRNSSTGTPQDGGSHLAMRSHSQSRLMYGTGLGVHDSVITPRKPKDFLPVASVQRFPVRTNADGVIWRALMVRWYGGPGLAQKS